MGLFSKKSKRSTVPELVLDEEQVTENEVNYNTVIDYLVGLSDEDYDKVGKMAMIYRDANKEACKVLGVDCEPTSFITEPEEPAPAEPTKIEVTDSEDELDNFLDDELNSAFLEDIDPNKDGKVPQKKAK